LLNIVGIKGLENCIFFTDKVQEMRVTLNHVVEKLFTAEIEIKQHKKRSNFSSSA